jgi:hypothetical protein
VAEPVPFCGCVARALRAGLAYWLEAEIVTALGSEHAVTEINRVYDRIKSQKGGERSEVRPLNQ